LKAKPISKELALELLERFKDRIPVGPKDQCWNYAGSISQAGYGSMYLYTGKRTIQYLAHRVVYVALRGEIPEGFEPDHTCRNRRCVNPWHIEVVAKRVNVLRGVGPTAINAQKTHCIRGHEFTPENTGWHRKYGGRFCRTCVNASNRESCKRRRRRRAASEEERNARTARRFGAIKAAGNCCSKGHEYTPENTVITKYGDVICRTCRRAYTRDSERRRRARAKAAQMTLWDDQTREAA
jgi:hypothetical protein